ITEVRIFPRESRDKKLKAYATVTFDDSFVVRDIKVIQGNKGYFVAMPSRKMKESCNKCGHRNAIRSKYCNQCGASLPVQEVMPAAKEERQSEHKDIAHPINSEFRDYIQKMVLKKYEELPESQAESRVESQGESQTIAPAEAGTDETQVSEEGKTEGFEAGI
ncbi:MAG: septation protein SpoVG family protein, partial [Candidatus Omnitrophica bacterium]|nr:septation protein SpoVG family protein [Candidatus Omnitrophota bacterium]